MVKKQREKKKPLESVKNYSNRFGTLFQNTSHDFGKNEIENALALSEKESPSHALSEHIYKHTLVRRDLLSYEHILCKDFAQFIKFEGHALYFPTEDELQSVEYIAEEKKLLLPLRRENALLGVLLLRNVRVSKSILPFLEDLARICLDKMYFLKNARLDERSSLLRFPYFMSLVFKEVCAIKKYYSQSIAKSYAQSASGVYSLSPSYSDTYYEGKENFEEAFSDTIWHNTPHTERQTSLGIMVLPVLGLDYIRKYYGFNMAEEVVLKLAHEIKKHVPEDVLCTLLNEDSFALFYGGATKRVMENLAQECARIEINTHAMPLPNMFASLETLMGDSMLFSEFFENTEVNEQSIDTISDKIRVNKGKKSDKIQGIRIQAKLCVGYALFPQDWDGTMHSHEDVEIPHILLNKAKIAAYRLKNTPHKKGISLEQENFHVAGQYLGYKQILFHSGSIEEILPYSQVRVNLGTQDGALENMCFTVWADRKRTRHKGEILLCQVSEKSAIAQILMLSDPAKTMEEGDFLSYAPQSQSKSMSLGEGTALFYAYQDFMDVVSEHISSQHIKTFSLSLLRIQWDKLAQKMLQFQEQETQHPFVPVSTENPEDLSTLENVPPHYKKKNFEEGSDKTFEAKKAKQVIMPFDMKDIAKQIYRYINAYNEKNGEQLVHNTSLSLADTMQTLELSDKDIYAQEPVRQKKQNSIDSVQESRENLESSFNTVALKERDICSICPLVGSMSFNSILVYQPAMDAENALILYKKIAEMIEEKFGVPCAIGIAIYPYLSLRPADMWDFCRKALDYAMLLPEPHVGVLDSLAINISADRKFSQGDTFGAVEEYRLALLADGNNILAWNSLGVCLAELGRYTEARNAFEVAYARNTKDAATCYNLGSANLSLGDRERAKEYFLACLSQESKHLFARIRLGEIAEKEENFAEAFEQYTLAGKDNPESSVPLRGLARLAMQENQKEKARELLQLALQKNSDDAVSLQLLAGLYLDGGEDAHLAEMLARQSVALLPWRRSAWSELARALEAQEKFAEATQVRRNSMRL